MTLDLETLDRWPSEGARVVALALLADAAEAAGRVRDPSDAEALHDFRVALRRLRSTLRAWQPALGDSLRKKDLRRLRKVARATNEARDAEVLLAWLGAVRAALAESHRPAVDWLASRLEHRRRAGGPVEPALLEDLARTFARLARSLASSGTAPASGAPTFGAALAGLVRAQGRALRDELGRVTSAEAVAHAHRARIAAKRLRYLLEPLLGAKKGDSREAVERLKELQDVLGELHDSHVAAAAVAAARVEAAAERLRLPGEDGLPGLRPGLIAVERAAHERAHRAFARLEADVLDRKAVTVLDPVYAVAVALEERSGTGDEPPPRRRYLLSELPDPARWGSVTEIEKGWLPGDRPRECYGVARSPGGESFFRAVFAPGPRRGGGQETEEVSRPVFEAFWPLTDGRRVHKRCFVAPGEPGWRFDEYLDRQLALAVAEPDNDRPLPQWLEPYVVREVTGERGYHDDVLARRPSRAKKGRDGAKAGGDAPAGGPGQAPRP